MTVCVCSALLVLGSLATTTAADDLPRRAQLGTALEPVGEGEPGVLVQEVLPGSSAEAAGLRAGGVITAVGEAPLQGPGELVALVARAKAGDTLPLALMRDGQAATKEVVLKERPRETSEDFEVIYGTVESRGSRLRTIVTKPKGDGPFPALFLIQGVGMATVDNPPGVLSSYRTIVGDLTRNGFATLRVDKPGVGDSEGGPAGEVDFDAELDGYRQALKALRGMPFVDRGRILLFGHSMGGVMAPLLSAEEPVKGIAVYGTLAVNWVEYMVPNVRRQLELRGEDPGEIDRAMRAEAAIQHLLFFEGLEPAEVIAKHPEFQGRLAEAMPDGRHFVGRHLGFFRQLARQDLGGAWSRCGARVLALWGAADFVSAEEDHARIARIVNLDGSERGEFRRLEGIDHGFNKAGSQEDSIHDPGPGEFNPLIVETLSEWATGLAG